MIYGDKMPKLMNMLEMVQSKLENELPAMALRFEELGISIAAAFSPLFISLYIYQVPLDIATRIFEIFIIEGETSLTKVLFKMLHHKREKILKMNDGKLMNFLRTKMFE